MPSMPTITSKHPRIIVNAAALTNLAYTGINVVQDMLAGHFSNDDKVFVASFLVGLVVLLVPLAGGTVTDTPDVAAPVVLQVEPAPVPTPEPEPKQP